MGTYEAAGKNANRINFMIYCQGEGLDSQAGTGRRWRCKVMTMWQEVSGKVLRYEDEDAAEK